MRTLDRSAAIVVAADAARARLFTVGLNAELEELADLDNEAARMHDGDLADDAGGRRGHRPTQAGASRYGGESMKEHRIEEFAAAVCERAARALREEHAERLYLVADPGFLGLMRQRMDDRLRKCVAGEVDKSLATRPPTEIRAVLPARL